jgi:hypothetical protein
MATNTKQGISGKAGKYIALLIFENSQVLQNPQHDGTMSKGTELRGPDSDRAVLWLSVVSACLRCLGIFRVLAS